MKRIILLFIIVILISPVFADNTPSSDYQSFVQKIAGYILDNEDMYTEDYTYLYVQEFIDPLGGSQSANGYHGINLDYTDADETLTYTSNAGTGLSYKYMIAPSSEKLTSLGLKISTFTVYVTFTTEQTSGAKLTISHSQLYWKAPDQTIDMTTGVDYELGALYSIDNGVSISDYTQQICLSTESTISLLESEKRIIIPLTSTVGRASIQDAGLFFRMTPGSFPTESGQYVSTVTFSLEAM